MAGALLGRLSRLLVPPMARLSVADPSAMPATTTTTGADAAAASTSGTNGTDATPPPPPPPPTTTTTTPQRCTLAAGCFWGVEALFRRHFADKGLLEVRVGYTGGSDADADAGAATYRAVCGGATGHAEAAELLFDPARLDYRTLLAFFFRMHDPTTADRQGPDVGTQYRSAIFVHDADQDRAARDVARRAADQWWPAAPLATQIRPAARFWPAEDYHQLYLDRNPAGYECPSHYVRDFPPLKP